MIRAPALLRIEGYTGRSRLKGSASVFNFELVAYVLIKRTPT
jgi:hypothetical protein